MNKNFIIGFLFIFIQIVSIAYARIIPERFFCWAPYDEQTYYEVFVEIDGKTLTKKEIEFRYHYKSVGYEPRAIHNIFNIINQYESTYGKNDKAIVNVKYSINGHEEKLWKAIN